MLWCSRDEKLREYGVFIQPVHSFIDSSGIIVDIQSLVIDGHGRGIADQLLAVARAELLLLVPDVRIDGELFDLGERKFLLWQEVIDALGVVGCNVVHLRKVFFLIECWLCEQCWVILRKLTWMTGVETNFNMLPVFLMVFFLCSSVMTRDQSSVACA
jgi:hypothetical protein